MWFAQPWKCNVWLFFHHVPAVTLPAKPVPHPAPAASPLCTLAAPPGPAVVMRGQRDEAAWVHPWSRGQRAQWRGKGYAGLRWILKQESITHSVAEIIRLPPSQLIKLPYDPKTPPAVQRQSRRFQHISTSNSFTGGKLTGRRWFLSSGKEEMGRKISLLNIFA